MKLLELLFGDAREPEREKHRERRDNMRLRDKAKPRKSKTKRPIQGNTSKGIAGRRGKA